MDLGTSITASTGIVVFGTGLFAFIWKYLFSNREGKSGSLNDNGRIKAAIERTKEEEKDKTKLWVAIKELKTNQINMANSVTELKHEVKEDFNILRDKIDDLAAAMK